VPIELWSRCRKSAPRDPKPSAPCADERARRYATELLAHAREELNRVDTKASILLAAAGIALSAVAGALVSRGWSPFRLHAAAAFLWWLGTGTVTGGIAALLAAIYPRHRPRSSPLSREPQANFGYYADVISYGSVANVMSAIRRSAKDELQSIAEQLLHVSQIVDRKYRLVGWGVWMLAAGVACDATALLIHAA
jgi:Pycsar effector protein